MIISEHGHENKDMFPIPKPLVDFDLEESRGKGDGEMKQRVLDQLGRDILRNPEPTTPLEEFINDLCQEFQTENLSNILEKNDSESTIILILLYHLLPTKRDLVQSLCPDFPLQKYTNPVNVKTFVKDGLASGFSDRKVNRVCFVGNQVRVL